MRTSRARVFIPLLCLSAFLMGVQAMSLWSFQWLLPGQGARVGLSQGQLRVWWSKPGDLVALPAGVHVGGWTGDVLQWQPRARSSQKLWVPTNPAGTPRTASAANMKQITGFEAAMPIAYVLATSLIATGWAFPAWRSRRQASQNACSACGYDVRRLPGKRCPECGGLLTRLVTQLRVWLRLVPVRLLPDA